MQDTRFETVTEWLVVLVEMLASGVANLRLSAPSKSMREEATSFVFQVIVAPPVVGVI